MSSKIHTEFLRVDCLLHVWQEIRRLAIGWVGYEVRLVISEPLYKFRSVVEASGT